MIKHILFDLDSTLYSKRWQLEETFHVRLKEYASSWLGMSPEEYEPIRNEALKHYGTTLEWLCTQKGFTAVEEFFAHVHPENEADNLPPDPDLRQFIENLPCPCSILTNSPGFHAERIVKKLGLDGLFIRIFDIESNNFLGKPHPTAFYRALEFLALKPEDVLFVDDMPRYVNGFIVIGGRGLLLDENDTHKNYPYEKIMNLRELTRFLY